VPRVSAFYGIVIWMYHDEIRHLGRAHFYARYGDDEASIGIEDLAVIAGRIRRGRSGLSSSGRSGTRRSCVRTGSVHVSISRSRRSTRFVRRSSI